MLAALDRPDVDEYRKSSYVRALGSLGDARAVGPLVRLLRADPDRSNLVFAIPAALAQIGDPAAVEPLIEALTYHRIRSAAIDALGALHDWRAIEPLQACLTREAENGLIRLRIADAIERIEASDATGAAVQLRTRK